MKLQPAFLFSYLLIPRFLGGMSNHQLKEQIKRRIMHNRHVADTSGVSSPK